MGFARLDGRRSQFTEIDTDRRNVRRGVSPRPALGVTGSATFCSATFDLSAAYDAGGTHAALRRLVNEWFGVENLPPTVSTVALLDVIRDDQVLSQIPQFQDRFPPKSKIAGPGWFGVQPLGRTDVEAGDPELEVSNSLPRPDV